VQYRPCNPFSCQKIVVKGNRKVPGVLDCKAKVDVTMVVDGSGSLGSYGWKASVLAATKMIDALTNKNAYDKDDPDHGVNIALMVFSGPIGWKQTNKCTGRSTVTMTQQFLAEDCGLEWLYKFADAKTGPEGIEQLKEYKWPAKTTFTSGALYEARAEQINARPDTNHIVVVFTDGRPMGFRATRKAAKKVRDTGSKLMFVPMGKNVPVRELKRMASHPKRDNVYVVKNFWETFQPWVLNSILGNVCPILQ